MKFANNYVIYFALQGFNLNITNYHHHHLLQCGSLISRSNLSHYPLSFLTGLFGWDVAYGQHDDLMYYLCCAVLCSDVLCYAVLCCAEL